MTTQNNAGKLIAKIIEQSSNKKLIESAFEFAREAYKDKFRISGENYIFHATRVAAELDKMNLDPATIAFGILHDVLDDTLESAKNIELEEIEKKFGKEISKLVERISSLGKLRYSLSIGIKENKRFTREKIENLRKMFLAMSGDLRVVLVELVSRLDGLNFLRYLTKDQQKLFALETLKIFVPVASRLGLSEIRRNLEDTAFECLLPKRFKWLKENIKQRYQKTERYLKKFIPRLKKILRKEGLSLADINYRTKSYWSVYKKLLRHDMDFDKIHDLLALRIITNDVASCYKALGAIHKHFKPISEEINDYIARPKVNGYKSLHTTIFSSENTITEIQIRTQEMHQEAEYGICAHWAYKENIDLGKEGPNKYLFTNKIFCFTPKGDIIVLPKNSTPVDFAYAIHSDVGNHCESAKVDRKIVHLSHILDNGEVVEISINKNKKPSKDWLRFVKTPLARAHIRKLTEESTGFKFPLPGFIRRRIDEFSESAKKKKEEQELIKKAAVKHIYLAGQKGMLIHIAKCCNPQPGDKVAAYLAPKRATALHKTSCSVFKKIAEKFPEKIIDASWQ